MILKAKIETGDSPITRMVELVDNASELRSIRFPNENNGFAFKKHQDKAGAAGEPDTHTLSDPTNENTGSATTAIGAETSGKVDNCSHEHTAFIAAKNPIIHLRRGMCA